MSDNVNHPQHYESQRIVLEPIDLCEGYSFNIGNALKYLLRAGKKEGNSEEQDLRKAQWYLKRELETLKWAGRDMAFTVEELRFDRKKCVDAQMRLLGTAFLFGSENKFLNDLFDDHLHGRGCGACISVRGINECLKRIEFVLSGSDEWILASGGPKTEAKTDAQPLTPLTVGLLGARK